MSLSDYYAHNYSKCNLSNSFLSSWKGVAYPSHVIQVFALPIQILTFYIIWKKTPNSMRIMKWPLFINHLCCTIVDILFCTFSTPYLFLHNISFMGLGFLSWLGVSNMFQIAFTFFTIFIMTGSYVYVFETRSSIIQMNRFKMTRTSTRVLYHGLLYLATSGVVLLMFTTPNNQASAKLISLKREPCPTVEFFENNVLVLLADPVIINFTLIYILLVILNIIFHILFHVICTVYHLYIVPSKSTSIETQKKQRKFFIGVIFQTTIPLFVLCSFVLVIIVDGITFSVSQEIMNLGVVACAAHGLIESVAVLSVHQSYRQTVLRILTRENHDKVSDIHVLPPASQRSNK